MSATFLTLNKLCLKNRCSDGCVFQQITNSRTIKDELIKNLKFKIRNLNNGLKFLKNRMTTLIKNVCYLSLLDEDLNISIIVSRYHNIPCQHHKLCGHSFVRTLIYSVDLFP